MASASAQDIGVFRVTRAARDVLVEMKATVRHGSGTGGYTAELTRAQVEKLLAAGFQPTVVHARLENESRSQLAAGAAGYTSYDQMRADFYAYAAAHPDIARLEVLGHSVQNRELFALKISGNAQIEEDEPEVVFWGSIHGNEFASAEVPYVYAMYLCDSYGVVPEVTDYVDQNEIWCIPLINPDGHEAGQRTNANNVDLNRDFGFQWDGWGGSSYPHSQVETRAVREFCVSNNITLASTMHCSGNVLFFPWGFGPNATPDDGIIQQVGNSYAAAASYGLVRSWVSYETHGELLDLVYGSHGGLCFTTEISNNVNLFSDTYARNRDGMNAFCELAGGGLHGVVTDASTGSPLWATVTVSGNDVPAYTDPQLGDVHRLLSAGTYDITVWANGYAPQTVSNVVVPDLSQPPAQFQVALDSCAGEFAFMVTAVDQKDPNNAYANTSPPANALGAPDGAACSLGSGGFIILDMGPEHPILNGPGDDFTVTEAVLPGDPDAEAYAVYCGDAYTPTTLIGTAQGTASFDLGQAGVSSTRYLRIVDLSGSNPNQPLAGMELDAVVILNGSGPKTYCTAGVSASGCQAAISASGTASATAASGFYLSASGVEGQRDGLFFFGTNGRQATPWGNGTSFQCVVPPVTRAGLLSATGTSGQCDGSFTQDLNALWCPACAKPFKNPGAGALVQAELWYRDPQNTSNRSTSLSNALEVSVCP